MGPPRPGVAVGPGLGAVWGRVRVGAHSGGWGPGSLGSPGSLSGREGQDQADRCGGALTPVGCVSLGRGPLVGWGPGAPRGGGGAGEPTGVSFLPAQEAQLQAARPPLPRCSPSLLPSLPAPSHNPLPLPTGHPQMTAITGAPVAWWLAGWEDKADSRARVPAAGPLTGPRGRPCPRPRLLCTARPPHPSRGSGPAVRQADAPGRPLVIICLSHVGGLWGDSCPTPVPRMSSDRVTSQGAPCRPRDNPPPPGTHLFVWSVTCRSLGWGAATPRGA